MPIATDDFNRPSLGANWTNAIGTVVIDSSSRVTGSDTGPQAAFYNAVSFNPQQQSQIVVESVGSGAWVGVCVRASANNFYEFLANATNWEVNKYIDGVLTNLASGSWTLAVSDVLRLEVSGSTLTAKRNGVTITTQTDSALTSGAPGVSFWTDSVWDSYGDNWQGSDTETHIGIRAPLVSFIPPPARTPAITWFWPPRQGTAIQNRAPLFYRLESFTFAPPTIAITNAFITACLQSPPVTSRAINCLVLAPAPALLALARSATQSTLIHQPRQRELTTGPHILASMTADNLIATITPAI